MVLACPRHLPEELPVLRRSSRATGTGRCVGLGRIAPAAPGAEQGPSLLRWVRTRTGQSGRGQAAGPSEEAKPGGRAGEATAELAATVAAPRVSA